MRILPFFKTVMRDQRGATAIEYGLIVSLIVLVMIGALQGFADESDGIWGKVSSRVNEAMN